MGSHPLVCNLIHGVNAFTLLKLAIVENVKRLFKRNLKVMETQEDSLRNRSLIFSLSRAIKITDLSYKTFYEVKRDDSIYFHDVRDSS